MIWSDQERGLFEKQLDYMGTIIVTDMDVRIQIKACHQWGYRKFNLKTAERVNTENTVNILFKHYDNHSGFNSCVAEKRNGKTYFTFTSEHIIVGYVTSEVLIFN